MWADDSNEVPSLIFSEKNDNKKNRMSSATIWLGALRVHYHSMRLANKKGP